MLANYIILCNTYYVIFAEITVMALNSISYEEVARAAETLRAEGRAVGPTKVRELLGRGSFSTVQKHLAEWEAQQAELRARQEEERRLGPPQELNAEVQKIMAAYWPHAIAQATEQMRPERTALEANLTNANARLRETLVEMANLENKLEAALVKASQLEDAERRVAEANTRIIAIQGELSRLEKIEIRFEEQKQLIQVLQNQVQSLPAQNAELSDVRRKLEAAQAQATRTGTLQEQNAALTKQVDELRAEVREASAKIARLEVQLETATGRSSPTKRPDK